MIIDGKQSKKRETVAKMGNQYDRRQPSKAIICLAVISTFIFATKLAEANHLVPASHHHQQNLINPQRQQFQPQSQPQQQQFNYNNNQRDLQMSASSSSHSIQNPSSLFKDLSGPTSGKIQTLDVICGKNFMTVRAEFSAPFYGIVFSKGTYGQENCIYVKPNSGLTHAAFNVYYDQCGTKPDLQGKFYENTIVIQYGSDIIEAYDEAKRLRCEWFEAYEKPATFKPAIPVADLEVVEMNFQGDDIDCWMEIQDGTGPSSREVSKIVPVGQPMTIVVAINDYNGQFDMRVKSCMAHDGVQPPIALTDEYGCVLRPKMLTAFQKVKNPSGINKKATILSYSRFLAFKFPDSMTVQIQCTVEVCRHGCADSCQRIPSIAATTMQPELSLMAKWPAAANQPALSPDSSQSRPQLSFSNASEQEFNSFQSPRQNSARPQSQSQPEDMSGSESAHQASTISVAASQSRPQFQPQPQTQSQPQPQAQQQNRRSQDDDALPIEQPSFVMPNRRQAFSGARLVPAMQPTTQASSSTTASPTTTTTSVASTIITNAPSSELVDQVAANRAGENQDQPADDSSSMDASQSNADNQQPPVVDESSLTRLNAANGSNEQSSSQSEDKQVAAKEQQLAGVGPTSVSSSSDSSDQQDLIKAESSQAKPSIVDSPSSQEQSELPASVKQDQQTGGNNGDQSGSENKPSVQGGDDEQVAPVVKSQSSQGDISAQQPQNSSPQSSLKTVEVEIPANEQESIRPFMAGSQQQQQQQAPSISSYDSIMFDNSRMYSNSNGNSNEQQVIQPRDRQRTSGDQLDEAAAAASQLMLGSGKIRFGARSSPTANANQAQQQQESAANYQQMDSSSLLNQARDQASSLDKVLIDRSDDSSLITELVGSSSGESSSVDRSDPMSVSESAPISSSSSLSSESASRPVVGTDELATGPIQIEDRMGSAASSSESSMSNGNSESLEEALNRLQRQIPQAAALVSNSQQQDIKKLPSSNIQTQSSIEIGNQQAPIDAEPSKRADDSNARKDQAQQQVSQQSMPANGQKTEQLAPSLSLQPQTHPNVLGQAKIIPDPSQTVLNSRGSMLAQASGAEGISMAQPVALNSSSASFKQPQQQQPQFSSKPNQPSVAMDQSKPVAQITNIPMGFSAFQQSQLPAVQQLQQQLAAQFQQQQQFQKQQQQQTTAKPSRGRFSLLQGPQAALQAVASRLLPKSAVAGQTANQQQQQQQPARLPSIVLPQMQQQQASANQLQQQQQLLQQFVAKQQQGASSANLGAANQPQAQPKMAGGLFSRLAGSLHSGSAQQQQAQALVRTRRSALMPSGPSGNGQVGVQRTFMVVTGMDLAFSPNSINDTELPQILEGRRLLGGDSIFDDDGEIVYGVCMPIVSLTFVLTCAFWLLVFLLGFCLHALIKSRRAAQQRSNDEQSHSYVAKKLAEDEQRS